MEESDNNVTLKEFKHIIEYEISRLDNIINSYYSQIIPVEFYLYGSILSILIFLTQFISDIKEKAEKDEITIILLLVITAIAFSFFAIIPIFGSIKTKSQIQTPLVKNVPYEKVLKENVRDKEIFKAKLLIPNAIILFFFHALFGFLILSPYYLDNISIVKWNKAYYWVFYFVITDIIVLISLFIKNEILYNLLFDFKNLLTNIRNIDFSRLARKQKSIIILAIFFMLVWLIFYPVFWYYLTFDFLRINIVNFTKIANENIFLFFLICFSTIIAIIKGNELIFKKYRIEVLQFKQEKYREIRRELYESTEPKITPLWNEFILNAPW